MWTGEEAYPTAGTTGILACRFFHKNLRWLPASLLAGGKRPRPYLGEGPPDAPQLALEGFTYSHVGSPPSSVVVFLGEPTMLHSQEKGEDDFEAKLKLKQLVDGPSDKLDDLLGYLDENWDGIYGSRNLKSKVGAKEVLVVGSGGIGKNIDLALCCRFKGRGMSWSRSG